MKRILKISFIAITALIIGLTGCSDDDNANSPIINEDLNSFTLAELNFARTDPAGYAEQRLKEYYDNGTDNGAYLDIRSTPAVPPLQVNEALERAASKYAKFLADNNKWGHNENGTPQERCEDEGYEYGVGENIAAGNINEYNAEVDPERAAIATVRNFIIDEGVPSLGHRKNIMDDRYKVVGLGYAKNESADYLNYFVHNFGVK